MLLYQSAGPDAGCGGELKEEEDLGFVYDFFLLPPEGSVPFFLLAKYHLRCLSLLNDMIYLHGLRLTELCGHGPSLGIIPSFKAG